MAFSSNFWEESNTTANTQLLGYYTYLFTCLFILVFSQSRAGSTQDQGIHNLPS
jgi:hypothetical protein